MRQKVAFHNLGCKVNSYEMEYVQQRFIENDFEVVPFDQKADVYIVNTCTVTNIADRKTRQMLHRAKKNNPDAVVVAMGCYVETNKDAAVCDEGIDVLIGNNDKGRAYEIVEGYIKDSKALNDGVSGEDASDFVYLNGDEPAEDADICSGSVSYKYDGMLPDISKVREYDDFRLETATEHTRAYIKIQDGCNQFCSYCAIPLARGRVRSRELSSIVEEITGLAQKGYKEFVLTGIHLSSYGVDKNNNKFYENKVESNCSNDIYFDGDVGDKYSTDFCFDSRIDEGCISLIDVVERVARIDGVKRIRLGSLEPRIIDDDFLSRLSRIDEICPHFHLSLQSGSDSVLKRMNRHYTTDEFYEKVKLIRKYFEHPAITTDVIVGFPGETDAEFGQTRRFLNKCDFYEAHIFKYSRRKGTAADKLPGQLTEKEKAARSSILIKESATRSKAFREYYIGKPVEVLFEEIVTVDGIRYLTGFTKEYVKVMCEGDDETMVNTIVNLTYQENVLAN